MIPKTLDEIKSFLIRTQYIVSELDDSQYAMLQLALQQGRNMRHLPNKNELLQARMDELNSYIDLDAEDWEEITEEKKDDT